MPYLMTEIEVTQPLPALSLSANETGLAVLVRRKGKPIAFWLETLPPYSVLTPSDLAPRIVTEARTKLLSEMTREELMMPLPPSRLPLITIAICTKDRPDNVARCLKSLQAIQPNVLAPVEILIVDNAPSDERTRELVAALPGIRYVRERKPGLNFARNRALREARGELLAYLDDDVTVDSGWLTGLFEAWAENPDAVAFTGQVLPYELATEAQIIFERRGGFRRGFEKIRYGQTLPGNRLYPSGAGIFGTGANMAFRRDILIKLGGFDEALDTGSPVPGGGDLDIFYRVIRAGYPLVYEPQYLIFHQHRRDMEGLRRQYQRSWGLGLMVYVAKCYRTDPSQRRKLRGLIGWWFLDQLQQLRRCLTGRYPLPPHMIIGELWGGIIGLFGGYSRSLKQIEKIRRQFS